MRFAPALLLCGVSAGVMAAAAPAALAESAEAQLRRVVATVAEGRLSDAIDGLDRLIQRHPNFRLAHLVRGDLMLARAQPLKVLGNTGHAATGRLEDLRAEARARLQAAREAPPPGTVPRHLLVLAPGQAHAIIVDASRSRVYVYENDRGEPRLVADYYSTLGKQGIDKLREGDQKTPLGVYHVTSMIPGAKLPDLYGWGAFPINYPNDWDRRAGKTGYGIWLHGVPRENYARAPRSSDGCIALANDEIAELAKRVQPGATPVVIAERVDWVTPGELRAERERFMRQLEAWRSDWESRDAERYLAHYARDFRAGAMDLAAWSAHKRRVNAGKKWIKVGLSNVSVLRSAGQDEVIEVTFDQDYRSSNLSQRARKRQYWVEEGGRWKIAYENTLGGQKLRLPESFKSAVTTKGAGS
ncbi:MAG: murein L,D-transpeptidase family protein [Burkholderiales bacterium]